MNLQPTQVKFLFSIVDSHGPVKWHDIPIPPGRSVKACREMLYRLKKRVDAGEGGIPKTKVPRKRKTAPNGKSEIDVQKCNYAPSHARVVNGSESDSNDNVNGDSEEGGTRSSKSRKRRASPEQHESPKTDTGESDSDAPVKFEKSVEDDEVKIGAFERF